MTKEQMKAGLLAGRTLVQEEWADHAEIRAVDELVAEGIATATIWKYQNSHQCEVRKVRTA